MKYAWTAFRTALWQQFRAWKTWALILLLPVLLALAAALMPETRQTAQVQVGVVLPPEGGEEFWQLLRERGDGVVTFLETELPELERQVSTGRWDCGLVLPEDFEERLETEETRGLITLYISDGSTVYPMVKETAAACLAALLAPKMALDYMEANGIEPLADPEWNLSEDDRVLVTVSADGRTLRPPMLAAAALDRVFQGLIALVLAVWAMLCAVDQGRWLETAAVQRFLPVRSATVLLLPRMAAAAVPAFAAAAAGVLVTGGGWHALAVLPAYLAALCGIALAAARIPALWRAFPVLMPVVPVLGFLLSPILLDPGAILPGLKAAVCWLPVNLYLSACGGSWISAAGLCVMALAGLCVSVCLDRRNAGSAGQSGREG